jgi:hypothetical protein
MLVDLIARRMRDDGYLPVAYDGRNLVLEGEIIHIPPRVGRHRPDVIGINPSTRSLCIGEAKTSDDLRSKRTQEQLLDYSKIMGRSSGQIADLIIGVTKDAEPSLTQILAELGLSNSPNVKHIVLPEELVDDE